MTVFTSRFRRPLIGALAGLLTLSLGAGLPAPKAHAATPVGFDLNARVLDGGEQVVAVTLDTSGLAIDPASVSATTFTVHAKASSPVPLAPGDVMYSLYDADRVVTGARFVKGDLVLDLKSGEGQPNAATLGYLVPAGRNVLLDLTYTITQNAPLKLTDGRELTLTGFTQGRLLDPEVDAFGAGESAAGIRYRLYEPTRRGNAKRALIVWLHGNGEGGLPGFYQNEAQLRANRGALGVTTATAQRIFRGAYVLAPQVPDTWYNIDTAGYDKAIKALIDRVVKTHRIDRNRVYVMGASAGGMMTIQLESRYPRFFAAGVPTAPALFLNRTGAYTMTAEQILGARKTPTWLIQSKDDPTVSYDKAAAWAYDLLKPYGKVLLTAYDHVVWDGYTFNGHWSWIYTARNDPTTAKGRTLWEWLSRQKLQVPMMKK